MWVISPDEMSKIAESIGKGKKEYFLDFMNLNDVADVLSNLTSNYSKLAREKEGSKQGKKSNAQLLRETRSKLKTQRKKVDEIKNRRNILHGSITGTGKPTREEIVAGKASDKFNKAKIDHGKKDMAMHKAQFSADQMGRLVNALLFASLKRHEVDIPESFEAEKFAWDEIAEYCENSGKFEQKDIETLRGFGEGIGIDTSQLKIDNSDLTEKMNGLKTAISDFYTSKYEVDDFEGSGINADSIKKAAVKNKKWEVDKKEWDSLGINLVKEKELLKSKKAAFDHASVLVQTSDNADVEHKKLLRLEAISQSIRDAIIEADDDYMDKMYKETLDGLTDWWEEIDEQDRYRPHYEDKRICLKSKTDSTIREIDFKTSGGETELLLVCACLALAEKSGAKMPIILDDCFTKNDPDTRKKMIAVVRDRFDSMIYITNDSNMAEQMSGVSGGTLRFHEYKDDSWSKAEWQEI
jgi:hypothetical protein